jgi:23S rRNA (cytidine2498-2'-O)-methyltransferase
MFLALLCSTNQFTFQTALVSINMFIFSPCQVGSEFVFKKEIKHLFPGLRPAFARPGFVSFKCETTPPENFLNRSVFARTAAVSLRKIETGNTDTPAGEIWKPAGEHRLVVNRVHVFQRDPLSPGEQHFEPHLPLEIIALHRQIIEQSPQPKFLGIGADDIFQPAQNGELVLDAAMIEPNLFLIGTHIVTENSPIHARYAGGIPPVTLPADAVSRAWLKFKEGLLWSGFSIQTGDRCLDIGASPGGCSQVLLPLGAEVTGIDPGAVDPVVLKHPRFTHIRSRIKETKPSVFHNVQWITADMNVAPNYTLDVLEEIVTKKKTDVRGLLFTLKLIHWELADGLPALLDRIRKFGFSDVRCKQLVFNRQEVMVAASGLKSR